MGPLNPGTQLMAVGLGLEQRSLSAILDVGSCCERCRYGRRIFPKITGIRSYDDRNADRRNVHENPIAPHYRPQIPRPVCAKVDV